MKQANNNEMDLVLQSLAKRGESSLFAQSAVWKRENDISEHLDADELNSYAEGLVPEMARARYTEHLADCAACRKVVVSLTQALGPASQVIKTEEQRGSGWWDKLGALLSLPVLRFGVPALALTAILSIAFLMLRKEQQPDFVAQHQPGTATAPVPESKEPTSSINEQPANNTGTALTVGPTPKAAPTIASSDDTTATFGGVKTERSPSDALSKKLFKDSTNPPPPPPASDIASKAAAPASVAEPTYTEHPKTGTFAAGRTLPGEEQKSADKKREQANETVTQTRARDDLNFSKETEKDYAYNANSPSGPRRSEGISSARGGVARKNKEDADDNDETRTVAGRRFRRQGNVWIDTAFASPQRTVNVRRGSEQFRALVADEPAIGNVANNLAGEIIVVWKGKAYRIR